MCEEEAAASGGIAKFDQPVCQGVRIAAGYQMDAIGLELLGQVGNEARILRVENVCLTLSHEADEFADVQAPVAAHNDAVDHR
jgi:hypothetical protein